MIIELGGFHALSDAILDNSISADNPSISESMIITILHLIKYSSKPPDLHLRKVFQKRTFEVYISRAVSSTQKIMKP